MDSAHMLRSAAAGAAAAARRLSNAAAAAVHAPASDYYGKVMAMDHKHRGATPQSKLTPFMQSLVDKVPHEIKTKYYGAGSPLPTGGLEGLTVMDIGSGSGRDSYVASNLVGARGVVVGLDMTDEHLTVARQHADAYCKTTLGYPKTNMRFVKGAMEKIRDAGVPDGSVDLIVSNCVINLSPDKRSVIQGMYDALKEGGEAIFTDVYCDRRLGNRVRHHEKLWGESFGGALYEQDFLRLCHAAGFLDPRVLNRAAIDVADPALTSVLGNAAFQSITYRLFKLREAETRCEDYGQVAVYLGSLAGSERAYVLDEQHRFETGRPVLVCGNTAAMVGESWLAKHFVLRGDKSTHFGLYDPAPAAVVSALHDASSQHQHGCQ